MVKSLINRVALVTGGASGIGQATVHLFAREGAKVAIADLQVEEGQETVDQVKHAGGEDVIGPYFADKKTHLKENVKPLQAKEETIYVLNNSDAKDHVAKRIPNKQTKVVGNSLHRRSVELEYALTSPRWNRVAVVTSIRLSLWCTR